MPDWEAVIGLEVHARLRTATKIFCACLASFGAPPNTNVCPVCLGYPGALPVLNRRAVELALRMALATGCRIDQSSRFARKNYFYPDLPKGYQISQFERPLARDGHVAFYSSNRHHDVRIQRIHMEEDAGKSLHEHPSASAGASLVDLNRAGVPLIEIVTEPDLGSSADAAACLTRVRQILMYTEVCDGNMEDGSLRCDANISVRHRGGPLGTRTEVKNLNSFRFLAHAIDYEIARQTRLLEDGGKVTQETRLFDPSSNETRVMRSKEEAHDYRYFDDPDLLPLVISDESVKTARASLPKLPAERAREYQEMHGLSITDAEILVVTRELADYFEEAAVASSNARAASNWTRNEVLRVLNESGTPLASFKVSPTSLGALIRLVDEGAIGGKAAKDVFDEMAVTGESAQAIVDRRGLGQISDRVTLRDIAVRIVEANPNQTSQYQAGKLQLFGFFVGKVMKETGGRANAAIVNEVLQEILSARPE